MKYETVLFDLDGTLLDTLEDLKDAVNHELDLAGYPRRTLEEVRSFVGNGLRMLMKRALPETCSEEEVTARTASMRAFYYENSMHKTKTYPGVLDVMERLRMQGVAVGVVSNKMDEAVKRLCAHFFPNLTEVAVGEMESVPRKPKPDMVDYALAQMGKSNVGTVYIGDSEVDVATAKNAGIDCIAVSWGFRPRAALEEARAEVIAATAEELWAALQG